MQAHRQPGSSVVSIPRRRRVIPTDRKLERHVRRSSTYRAPHPIEPGEGARCVGLGRARSTDFQLVQNDNGPGMASGLFDVLTLLMRANLPPQQQTRR
jgi:hypothetical protein